MKEQLRKIVREIMREQCISEMNEGENPCWDTHKVGNPKTKISDKTGKRVPNCVPKNESINESLINEGPSSEELRIVMMAVRKISKYRNVPIDQSINDVLNAAEQLQRDIKKGKIKK